MRLSLSFEQKKVEVSYLNLKIWKPRQWLLTKEVIKRLALLIIKRLIDQEFQTVITGITYSALTARSLDIHERNARNFMVSQPHLAKSGVTMEGNGGIMSKLTCLKFSQSKKNP